MTTSILPALRAFLRPGVAAHPCRYGVQFFALYREAIA